MSRDGCENYLLPKEAVQAGGLNLEENSAIATGGIMV
jgi:hypothetical protein